jgi:hypothetical protein
MRYRKFLAISIVVAVLLNALLIYLRVSKRLSTNDLAAGGRIARAERAAEIAKLDVAAAELIAEWNQGNVTPLDPKNLLESVKLLPSQDCLSILGGSTLIRKADLTPHQIDDLNLAIAGLLTAFGANDPKALIDYMRERDKQFANRFRPILIKALLRRGQTNVDGLSGEELYVRMWNAMRLNTHWSGFVAPSSCLQVWDGSSLSIEQIARFDTTEAMVRESSAAKLFSIFRGSETLRHHFEPTKGTLDTALLNDETLLLADVKLIVELDDKHFNDKSAYFTRFWFNDIAEKWQPICMMGFASHPVRLSLPVLMF